MSTKYPEIFASLAAAFDRDEVKALPKGGKKFLYITARTVANRLDAVVGPENWWDDYTPGEHSVMCRLTLRLPGGEVVTKCDAGAYAGMSDQGDDDKSGFSDAFKRAAAKFGVGRYLYGDGIPGYGEVPNEEPEPQPQAQASPTSEDFDRDSPFGGWVTSKAESGGLKRWEVVGKLYKRVLAEGEKQGKTYVEPGLRGGPMWRAVADLWDGTWRQWMEAKIEKALADMAACK